MAYGFNLNNSQYLSTTSAPHSGAPMTISCKARFVSTGTNQSYISVGKNNDFSRNQIGMRNTGATQFGSFGTTSDFPIGDVVVSDNTQIHLCGVFASQASRVLWLDGAITASSSVDVGTYSTFDSVIIGSRYNPGLGLYASGDISDVGIWSVALDDDEIKCLAKGMACDKVRPQSLAFYAPLVRDLIDVRGGLTITNNNAATVANHPRIYQ